MALVVIGSAKAAPGVTTLTVALAALCPGPTVAADLDPEGGDLGIRYRAPDGGPLNPEVGLLSLAASLRGDPAPSRSFRAEPTPPAQAADALPAHLQTTAGGLDVLLGVNGPDQAVGLGPLWSPLARALAETPATVFADCGRIGAASPALPVVRQADVVILVARAELEELAHLRERLRYLTGLVAGRFSGPTRLGVVLVTGERDRAAGPRTEQLLRSSGVAVPVIGTVADDPKGAARLRGVGGGRAERTTLIRSVRALVPQIAGLAGVGAQAPASLFSAPAPPPPGSPPAGPFAGSPSGPFAESGPVAPVESAGPAGPIRPVGPVGPVGPAGPVAPAHLGDSAARPPDPPAGGPPDRSPAAAPPTPPPTPPNALPPPPGSTGSLSRRAARTGHAPTARGGESWRDAETPPGGTGWPGEPPVDAAVDPYAVFAVAPGPHDPPPPGAPASPPPPPTPEPPTPASLASPADPTHADPTHADRSYSGAGAPEGRRR
jgi:hypothetical protein